MDAERHDINRNIRRVSTVISTELFIAAICAMFYLGETPLQVLKEFGTILVSPCPLVTDYFQLGSLPAALLNASLCGFGCRYLLRLHHVKFRPNVWAGYFLVIAHCFYGLNFLSMWFPMFGFFVYCRIHKLKFRDNLDWAMFITSFAPFFSEILFRYPMAAHLHIHLGSVEYDLLRIPLALLLSIFVGCTLPAILPGTGKLHRGYNLYNGGLATGILGLFIYAFMFNTFGIKPSGAVITENAVYEAHGNSYLLFGSVFFIIMSLTCILYGWYTNGKSFAGYKALLNESGYKANFLKDYKTGVVWINLGVYCLMMLAYFDLVILCTNGAGFTGATFGIILAAMTFSASGQHPKNVWPILLGYGALSLFVHLYCFVLGLPVPWTLSTQGYMNGLAFATGLCPFSGKFGWKIGILAGFISAVMCTTTSVMHGGFVLYNGGLTAGLSALILLPLLDTYLTHTEKWGRREHIVRDKDRLNNPADSETTK